MQTQITEEYLHTPEGREADTILRSCVHCGFCTATCPTYQLLGDELDGPRGRIYLIKQMLEGNPVSTHTQTHLDRCLTCRSCETTCPSGVRYGRLVDIGRELVEQKVHRGVVERTKRRLLRRVLPYPSRFRPLLRLGQAMAPLLPASLRRKVPPRPAPSPWPTGANHPRRMLVLGGCAQSVATPQTNAAAARLLHKLGIELLEAPRAGCCGAVDLHLAAGDEARAFMRRNIDAWWPHIQGGAEAIVVTASGCGTVVKDYGESLRDDPDYARKAKRVSALAKDIGEVVRAEGLPKERLRAVNRRVAFHSPCTLQHGQRLNGVVEAILGEAGYTLTTVADPHLCCGSAGTYSILQPELSQRLLANKVEALCADGPQVIASANVGCQLHLASGTAVPVRHWVELVDEAVTP